MKKQNLIIALLLFGFISIYAQSDETKEKIKNLEGDITKITIQTEDGKVEITGDDAEILFKKIKAKKSIKIKKMYSVNSNKHGDVIFLEKGKAHGDSEITIDVDIDDTDGEKVIVVKKSMDGKETVEEYKGEGAEEFLKKHSKGKFISDDGEVHIMMELDSDDLNWVSKTGEECVTKNINVEVNDGVKKVTVTTTEDGNENVEVYEGDEADKFLEEHSKGAEKMMFISDDGDLIDVSVTMDSDDLHWVSDDNCDEISKKINVEVEDGIKTITVTTTKDGKEKVEVFTGDEADEYIEKMKHGKKIKIHISEDGEKKIIKKEVIIIEEDDDNDKD